jgi:hypothetical protein
VTSAPSSAYNSLSQSTDYAIITKSVALQAGKTYSFAWEFVSVDYAPWNDGVLFTVSGTGLATPTVKIIAAMGGSDTPPFNGVQPTTIATGSDGATTWFVQTFTVPTDGTYQIGFADYNWSDQAVNPVAFFANATGTVSGGPIVGVVASGSNIDTSQPFYAASGLGTTISPVFTGGTLRLDQAGATYPQDFTLDGSGTLTFTAPVVLTSGSTSEFDIDGTGTGAGNYSRIIVTGAGNTATVAGVLEPLLRGITGSATNTYSPPIGQLFPVLIAQGGVTGSYASLTQPAGLPTGTRFDAIYAPLSLTLAVTPSFYGNLPLAGLPETANEAACGWTMTNGRSSRRLG